jgi:serine/threonine-protein kinase
MDRCLDDNEVQALFRGRLSPSQNGILQAHVDRCNVCRHLVAEVARSTSENAALDPRMVSTLPLGASPAPPEKIVIRDGKLRRQPSEPDPRTVPLRRGGQRIGVGVTIGDRYRIDRVLGEGGTGVVWEATHVVMRRRVAIKALKSTDEEAQRRFFREARVTANLRHPHIVEVHDLFVIPETSTPVMVMELLSGAPLSRFLVEGEALGVTQVARIFVQVVSAVGAAHTVGVVHRDLKPENVFLVGDSPSLDDPRVKVLDFGLAKLTATEGDVASTGRLTKSGFVLGTPLYMAPEQVATDPDVDTRTDVWALGVMLYEALAGVRPIEAKNLTSLVRAIADPKIVPLQKRAPSLPKGLAKLVGKMLSKSKKDRPSLDAIHDVLAEHV